MRAATLSIGDELVCGQVIDTNAGTVAAALLGCGIRVLRHVTVGDNEDQISAVLQELAASHDAVVITGGLGPTADDVTAAAAARAVGRRLVADAVAVAHVRKMTGLFFATASAVAGIAQDKQALVPEGSALLPNPVGTACGFMYSLQGCTLYFLPGVPSEMTGMLHDTVLPSLRGGEASGRVIRTASLNVFGCSEAAVDRLLAGIAAPDAGLYLGICVTFPWMRVTFRAEAPDHDAAMALLDPAVEQAKARLGDSLFSAGDESMDEVVVRLLRGNGCSLALAESCTGGMIAQRMTSVPGSSGCFLEGAVTYGNQAKTRVLGVSQELLADYGAVSSEVAIAMADGIRRASGSDLSLAVTGIAGPEGGSDEKPVGTVFIALSSRDRCQVRRFHFHGSREEIRVMTSWSGLDWLRRHLLRRPAV